MLRPRIRRGVGWAHIAAAGILAGIDFTMALVIASLAMPSPAMLDQAKVGMLFASAVAGVAGWLLLARDSRPGATR